MTETADALTAVRTEFRAVPARELLHREASVLLGVDDDAVAALAHLEISSVFDLATSAVFHVADKLVRAAADPASPIFQHGVPGADMVKGPLADTKSVDELQFEPITVLQGVPDADAAEIESALDVQAVRDLAFYPPYLAARRLLDSVYFPENAPGFDREMPADLLPTTGEFPTERVQYSTLLLDEIKTGDGDAFVDVASANFSAIDLGTVAAGDTGFQRVAYGALLTFNQSWYAHGVTLGQLLHSVALAPGESTRLAVIDWSRKSRAGQSEVIDEVDDLTNDMSHNRSISEVTKAVATEAQGGFSSTNTNSTTTQHAESGSGESSGGLVGSILGGGSSSWGTTDSESTTAAHADSYSSSWGRRDIASDMLQNINDRTHQHAHSSRSRRASVVKEVSQTEHETVSTRVIANYNHMHAMTVQYYEVVQIYQVEVQLAKAERVLFVPLALLDFEDEAMVRRFQTVLAGAALSQDIRTALANLDVIEIAPEPRTRFTGLGSALDSFLKDAIFTRATRAESPATTPAEGSAGEGPEAEKVTLAGVRAAMADVLAHADVPVTSPLTSPVTPGRPTLGTAVGAVAQVNDRLWAGEQASRLSGLLNVMVLRRNSNSMYLPTDVWIEGMVVASGGVQLTPVLQTQAGTRITSVSPANPVAMSEVSAISVSATNVPVQTEATVTLTLNRNGVRFPFELPSVTIRQGFTGDTRVVRVRPGGVNENLKRHLMANRLHYSQAVFRSLDSAQIALLLSGYRVEVAGQLVPVAQVVDPRPLRYVGNFLAFKMSASARDEVWTAWLKDRGIEVGSASTDVVPLASGGTFAEAVLGRANSAEKLDITRFWNWQDSPIPLQPTEIAAIQTGSRAMDENITPGQLSSPVVAMMSPGALPDPAGTAAVLSALQNGNMFRDMSGLQASIGLAQSALQASAAGASTAGQQAGTNMQNHLQAQTERMRIAADLAKSAIAAYAGAPDTKSGGSKSNHSQDGAKVNYFDKAGKGAGNGAGGTGGTDGGGSGGSGGGSNGGGTSGSGGGGTTALETGGNGYSQNPGILSATWGDTKPPSNLVSSLIDRITGDGEDPSAGAVAAGNATAAWPKLDRTTVVDRLKVLRGSPNAFDQGSVGLCTAAALFHHVLQKTPPKFMQFANAMYGAGVGYLGDLKVRGGYDLRHADYQALAANHAGFPPQADWMCMCALRDSENWFFDFEGDPDDEDIETSAKELSSWYEDTGFYSDVNFSSDRSSAKIKTISKNANNHVALWVATQMVAPGAGGAHMITVESPITINEGNDSITFDYWTWGQPIKTLATSFTSFKNDYYGVIAAKF